MSTTQSCLASSRDTRAAEFEVRTNLANLIGGDNELAALPRSGPADLTTDRIATLIDDLMAEIRDVIAHPAPGSLVETAPTVV